MALFRPSNLNKRLVSATGGNGGVIGPTKTPYCISPPPCATLQLGQRYFGGSGSCTGRFSISESFCGTKNGCATDLTDCAGFYICCGPSTNKWFIAPSCTQVSRTWYCRGDAVTVANSCMGSCGWFIPSLSQLQNPGYTCRTYWDSYSIAFGVACFWSNTASGIHGSHAQLVSFHVPPGGNAVQKLQNSTYTVRAFRCTAT